ncbi:MAG: hypothetical protein EG823_05565 [Actinobacteria bacterium]|nr:hypothetical protein [Actinomycetota bacterium]
MTPLAAYAVAGGVAVVAGWAVPHLAMRGLASTLESSRLRARNYRGTEVFLGLGIVWAVWAVALLVAGTLVEAVATLSDVSYGSVEMGLLEGPLTMPLYAVPIILTTGALLFGMLDDVFGSHGDKGFRGHLGALFAGRLTTGGMKLVGIGALAAVYGWHAAEKGAAAGHIASVSTRMLWWMAATVVIALTANLVNLMDLRPGRALKTYSVLAVAAGVAFSLNAVAQYRAFIAQSGAVFGTADAVVTVACMLTVLLGPVSAVWRLDLGERGMLGDSGSNAMGAIVGYLMAGSLPLPWLGALAVVLLAMNVLSERVSFSAMIEKTPPLRFLDGLGRLKVATGASDPEGETQGKRRVRYDAGAGKRS